LIKYYGCEDINYDFVVVTTRDIQSNIMVEDYNINWNKLFWLLSSFQKLCVLSLKKGMISILTQQHYCYLLKFVFKSTSWIKMYILTHKIYLEEKIYKIIVFVNLKFNLLYDFRELGILQF